MTGPLSEKIVVISDRKKYVLTGFSELQGQTVDVSVDDAHVKDNEKGPHYFSIEFGVGHPGRNIVSNVIETRVFHKLIDVNLQAYDRSDVAPFEQVRNKVIDLINKKLGSSQVPHNTNNGGFKAVSLHKETFDIKD